MDTQDELLARILDAAARKNTRADQLRQYTDLRTPVAKCIEFENCPILGYYAATSGNSLPAFPGQPIGPIFKGLENGVDRLFQNVVTNYYYSLRNKTEKRSSHLVRVGSLNYAMRLRVVFQTFIENCKKTVISV